MAQAGVNPHTAADLLRQAMAQKYVSLQLYHPEITPQTSNIRLLYTTLEKASSITCHGYACVEACKFLALDGK